MKDTALIRYGYRVPDARLDRFQGNAHLATLLRQDRLVIQPVDSGGVKGVAVAVFDFANNFNGRREYRCPEVAHLINTELRRSLPAYQDYAAAQRLPNDAIFNLGTMGSAVAADFVRRQPTLTGEALVRGLNRELRQLYRKLLDTDGQPCPLLDPRLRDGIDEAEILRALGDRRSELATGYIAHGLVTSGWAKFTGVGDARAALDGNVLVGHTKLIDTEKDQLVDFIVERTLAGGFTSVLYAEIVRRVAAYGLAADAVDELVKDLATAGTTRDDLRQVVYLWRERHITRWQFNWQNVPGSPYTYGALDGTQTLAGTIQERSRPLRARQTLAFYTDGVQLDPDGMTGRLADPKYGEATLALLTVGSALSRPRVAPDLVLEA